MQHFDGITYSSDRDGTRLRKQLQAVWSYMRVNDWVTLAEVATVTGYPEASISARLRDFRKARFGRNIVNREYLGQGQWEYQLVPSDKGLI